MPRIFDNTTEQEYQGRGGSFTFSGVRPDRLSETRYTLVTIVTDTSGSVGSFADQLLATIGKAIDACKKAPTSENIMVRRIDFNNDVKEVHGFRLVGDIDPAGYPPLHCYGQTALVDAIYQATTAAHDYAVTLAEQDFDVNGICLVITDGDDNASSTPRPICAEALRSAVKLELMDSYKTIVIGINNAQQSSNQIRLVGDLGIEEFIDAGDATPGKLAKLAAFISQSVTSTSQAHGSGQPASTPTF